LGVLDHVEVAPHPLYAAATIVALTAGLWSTFIAVPSDSVAERILSAAA
jgi:hypothetical protein